MPHVDDDLDVLQRRVQDAQSDYDHAKTDDERNEAERKLEAADKALRERMKHKGVSRHGTGVFF